MISIDSNLLLYSFAAASPFHGSSLRFIETLDQRDDVALSELVLVELYTLLRNPAVLESPLGAAEAAHVVQTYRRHPRWMCLGFASDDRSTHDELWAMAATTSFARRRIYDARTALSLRRQGVTEFATANVKDFEDLGFERVWNPIG